LRGGGVLKTKKEINMPNAQIVAGNWKMNGTAESAVKLAQEIVAGAAGLPATVVLCPPAVHIPYVADITKGNAVVVGGQDCHFEESGAHTGDISPNMLKNLACEFVIVGHSERRQDHKEYNQLVKKKAGAAINAGLRPVICVGEVLEERKSGKALEVVEGQIVNSIPENADGTNIVVAYEPVWAIGTGEVPTSDDIKEMHLHILKTLQNISEKFANNVKVLYGGSVKANNADEILSLEGVGGVLVGGASLDASGFLEIIKAAK
jgi:triosephosphate isomerase